MLTPRWDDHGKLRVDGGVTTAVLNPDAPVSHPDDRYPNIICDQRHGYGCTTVTEIEDYWLDHLDRQGLEPWWDGREAVPYINRGRWLIGCPACNAGAYAWDHNPLACCLDCGLLVEVAWQSPFVRSHAVRLLAVRPLHAVNWDAHKGETVQDLEVENRWLLNEHSVLKDGLIVPTGLAV